MDVKVFEAPAGERLDVAIAAALAMSRTYAKELVSGGYVQLDGRPVAKAALKLSGAELVSVLLPPPKPMRVEAEDLELTVIYEDEELAATPLDFDQLLSQCVAVSASAPDGSRIDLAFAALEVPDLGDESGGLSITTSVSAPDGTQLAVPGYLAVVVDGSRVLVMQQTGDGITPLDPAAFTALVEQAAEAAAA